MDSPLFFYPLALVARVWLFVRLPGTGSKPGPPTPPVPAQPQRKRSTAPKACVGLTHNPPCVLCEQATADTAPPPPGRPAPRPPTNRRPRTVDPSRPFGPHPAWDDRGWRGLGTLRANGHPRGGPWRQGHWRGCSGFFPEHHGTMVPGKPAAGELSVRVLACLAEGLGMRATARGGEVDPTAGRQGRGDAAEPLRACSASCLCDVHGRQLPLDEG